MLSSLNPKAIVALKYLCGLPDGDAKAEGFPEENINLIQNMANAFGSMISGDYDYFPIDVRGTLFQVRSISYREVSLNSSFCLALCCGHHSIVDLTGFRFYEVIVFVVAKAYLFSY